MSIDPNRLHHLLTLRDDRHARLLAASERTRDERARRWQALKSIEALEFNIDHRLYADERDRLTTELHKTQEQLSASEARLEILKDEELRLRDEWQATGRLASAAEAYADAKGVKVGSTPIIGPDPSLAHRVDGRVHA